MTDEEMKRRLRAEADKAIERLIADKPAGQPMSLREVEGLAVRVGAALSVSAQTVLSEAVSQRYDEQGPVCPQCGTRMQRRGEHVRHLTTEAGSSPVRRTYYECAGCGSHFFPSGRGLGSG